MAMSAMTITNSTIYDTPPGDLVNNATAVFKSTGASDAQVQALVQNPQYSLSVLTALAQGVQRLKDVPGRDAVVGFAAAASTQDETRLPRRGHEHAGPPPRIRVTDHAGLRRRAPSSAAPPPAPCWFPSPSTTSPGPRASPVTRSDCPRAGRAGPVRFRPGLAPRPEGAHQAGLEGQRGVLHRGRAVERLTGGLTPSPPVVVRAAAGTHTIGFDFTCAETLTPERVSQSPLLTASGVPADPAVVASRKPGL